MQKTPIELAGAFRRLAESLQQLANSLGELSSSLGWPLYRRFNMPFGPSDEGRKIWIRYRQYTTLN